MNPGPAPMKIVIADDEVWARARLERLIGQVEGVEIAAVCADVPSAIAAIERTGAEGAFLDIQMEDATGFEVLDGVSRELYVVFVTAYSEHALRAFERHAVDYLLKPYTEERLQEAVRRIRRLRDNALAARAQAGPDPYPRRIAGASGRTRHVIDTDAIQLAIARANYVEIHARGGQHLIRGTLGALVGKLDPAKFAQVSRSIVVRVDAIRRVDGFVGGQYLLTLEGGAKVRTGRNYRKAINALLESAPRP